MTVEPHVQRYMEMVSHKKGKDAILAFLRFRDDSGIVRHRYQYRDDCVPTENTVFRSNGRLPARLKRGPRYVGAPDDLILPMIVRRINVQLGSESAAFRARVGL